MSEETTAPEQQAQDGEQLSYGDILASVQVIDVVSSRGAIKGDELVQVGTLRERLIGFLRAAKDAGLADIELPPSSYNPVEEAPAEEAPAEAAE